MKPRFFADTRDLFKYDLVQVLMEGIPGPAGRPGSAGAGAVSGGWGPSRQSRDRPGGTGAPRDGIPLRRFLFVPMLTRDDGKRGGYHDLSKARAGYLNRDLLAFLERCNGRRERDVSRIRSYFEGLGIDTTIVTTLFTHPGRRAYFDRMTGRILPATLILLDPDNGLETRHPGEKHLLFSELSSILGAIDAGSLVMVFQYYPRVDRGRYRDGRVREIFRRTGHRPLWITDNQVLFFLMAGDGRVRTRAAGILDGYSSRYPGLATGE